jgi:hypothetical protein
MHLLVAFIVVMFAVAIFGILAYHPSMRLLVLPLLCLSLCHCSTQVITRADGSRIVNNNLISAGTLTVDSAGNILMSGTSEEAGKQLAQHLRMAAMFGIAGQSVEAIKDVGTEALKK